MQLSLIRGSFGPWPAALMLLGAVMTAGCGGHGASNQTHAGNRPSKAAPAASGAAATPVGRFPLVVSTDRGAIRGSLSPDGRVEDFLGVPYAAPPVGNLRWQPPRRPSTWASIRAADRYRSECAQPSSSNGPAATTEDCLYVNVQRPARGGVRQRLPVYVYIHGGGLTSGAGSDFNMDKIVRDTGVIGVTLNYRLGVFGFLAHPGLTAEQGESGNYGLLDQQAALRWVQGNIAAFGGDPSRVTIGGESSGGWAVCALLVSPRSRGLFARAMLQSGSCPSRTPTEAQTAGIRFAAEAGCSDGDSHEVMACLRALSPGQITGAEDRFGFTPMFVRGTRTLPVDPLTAIRNGDFPHIPILIGGTRDEARAFTSDDIGWSREDYENWVTDMFAGNASRVIAQYPWPPDADQLTPAYLTAAVITDAGLIGPNATVEHGVGGCATRSLIADIARYTRTYAYEWAAQTGPGIVTVPGYSVAAGHGSELAYLWPNFKQNGIRLSSLFGLRQWRLSDQIVRYWGAFVKTGSPGDAGGPPWLPYTAGAQATLSLRGAGLTGLVAGATIAAEHRCSFWDQVTAP